MKARLYRFGSAVGVFAALTYVLSAGIKWR
jgi:hypothetical protein